MKTGRFFACTRAIFKILQVQFLCSLKTSFPRIKSAANPVG